MDIGGAKMIEELKMQSMKSLWKLVFEDEDGFIDYYFQKYDSEKTRVIRNLPEEVVAQMHMHNFKDWTTFGSYIYGVATHPEYRGRGLARKIIAESFQRIYREGVEYALLIAEEESLRGWYGTMDFVLRNGIISVHGEEDGMNFGMDDNTLNRGMYRVVNILKHMQRYAHENPSRYSLFGVDDAMVPDNTGVYSVKDGNVTFFPGLPDFATISPARIIESFPVSYTKTIEIPYANK